MVLKHVSQEIWAKVNKEIYQKKFANIEAVASYEEVSTNHSSRLLAELIE